MTVCLYNADKCIENLSKAGFSKACAPPSKLYFGGFIAGALIGLGFLFAIMSSGAFYPFSPDLATSLGLEKTYRLPNYSLFKLLLGATFPVGLIAILIGGADLRTGNVQVPFYARMTGRMSIKKVIYNRVTSYGGNFFGGFFVAYLAIAGSLLVSGKLFGEVVLAIAEKKVSLTFRQAFRRGIGCNRLVNVAVWLYARATDTSGKRLGIRFPIFAFVTIGFEHSIANMRILSAAVMLGGITRSQMFHNLIPVTLGNAVGGFLFVAFYYRYIGSEATPKEAVRVVGEFLIATTALLVIDVLPMAAITYVLSSLPTLVVAGVVVIYLFIASEIVYRIFSR